MSATAQQSPIEIPARWRADAGLILVSLIWGTTFVAVKQALDQITPVYFLALRFLVASSCLLLFFGNSFRKATRPALLSGFRGGAIAGLFLWSGYMLQTFGLKYTSAANSGFITGLYIVLVPLVGTAVYRRWPRPAELSGVFIATAGLILLAVPSLKTISINPGDVLTICCAVAFAIHLLILGYFAQRENVQAVALGQIACAAVLSGFSLTWEPPKAIWSPSLLFAIVLTAVFATAVAFALQTWAQKYTTPTRTAVIFALEPVFALVTAIFLGGEHLSFARFFGAALILAGILLVELKPGWLA